MRALLLALCFSFSVLSSASQGESKWFLEDRTYKHYLFPSYQACSEEQSDEFVINCVQLLELYTDGTAMIYLTDIMNDAVYEIQGDELILKTTGPGDAPAEMTFKMDATRRNLVDKNSLQIWELELFSEK